MPRASRSGRRIATISILLSGAFLLTGGAGATATASPLSPATYASYTWAGYVVTVTSASYHFSNVSASWVVPAYVGTCSSTAVNQTAKIFVAMDGVSSSTTLEAVGVQMTCDHGKVAYHGFYWYYPATLKFWAMAIHAGDSVSAFMTHSGAGFNGTVRDSTTGAWGWASRHLPAGLASTVEWIVGRPVFGTSTLHKLPDFGHVTLKGCKFKISGVSHTLSSLSPTGPTFIMYNKAGTLPLTSVSGVGSGSSFTVSWLRAGP